MRPLVLTAIGAVILPFALLLQVAPLVVGALLLVLAGCLLSLTRDPLWFGVASAGSVLTLVTTYAVLASDRGDWRLYGLVVGMEAVIFGCCYGVSRGAEPGSRLSGDAKALAWASLLIHATFLIVVSTLAGGLAGSVEMYGFWVLPFVWVPPLILGFSLFAIVLVRGARIGSVARPA